MSRFFAAQITETFRGNFNFSRSFLMQLFYDALGLPSLVGPFILHNGNRPPSPRHTYNMFQTKLTATDVVR